MSRLGRGPFGAQKVAPRRHVPHNNGGLIGNAFPAIEKFFSLCNYGAIALCIARGAQASGNMEIAHAKSWKKDKEHEDVLWGR